MIESINGFNEKVTKVIDHFSTIKKRRMDLLSSNVLNDY